MKRFIYISRALMVLVPLVALLSLGRMVVDWVEFTQLAGPIADAPTRSYDGIVWQDDDGTIEARFVFPQSPADEAGIEPGDAFYMLEYQQYFNVEDLQRAAEGIPPGETRTYYVRRGDDFAQADVTFTRYPTFLYPLSTTLWHFSVWGFALGAFLHILGLIITTPLARRSRRAKFSFLVILASALWFFSNTFRLGLVDLTGPPSPEGLYATIFQSLTFIGLTGWIAFPALLLHKVSEDTHKALRLSPGWMVAFLYLPAVLLGTAAVVAAVGQGIGPFTLDSLLAPILFYACCYIAVAALVIILYRLTGMRRKAPLPGGWGIAGSILLFAVAGFLALSVYGVVPIFGMIAELEAGWLVVSAQLLSIVPVGLVSYGTLRSGKPGVVLSRALTYVATLGFIFFAFLGGVSLLDAYVEHGTLAHNVISGIYVVVLLLLFERFARHAQEYARHLFTTERQETRKRLARFQEQMRKILDHEALARQTVTVIGDAFKVKSARLFLLDGSEDDTWISGAYNPQPPYLTERVVARLWPFFEREGRIWADNPELNESKLPEGRAQLLIERGAALAIPIMGDGKPIGLLVLGPRQHRRRIWNLSDLDLLRSISGQLALAVERLDLVAREKDLVRESAEAELMALRAQINPHFLFNALNTIMALISERPDRAEQTVEHLANIFRHILQAGSQPYVSLQDEFDLIEHYLNIEKSRFGDRLEIELDLPRRLRDHPVPAFAVQTLVENAVKHGIAEKRDGGRVTVRATDNDEAVYIEVDDTGAGIPALFEEDGESAPQERFFGIGLRNVSARLEQLYDQGGLLNIESNPEEGTTATITLPRTGTPDTDELRQVSSYPGGSKPEYASS